MKRNFKSFMTFLRKVAGFVLRIPRNFIFFFKMQKNKRLKHSIDQPIVFICQNQAIWSRTKSIVSDLIKEQKKIFLLIVKDDVISSENKTVFEIDFPGYCIHYYKNAFKDVKPQLVIYSRPYSAHLPKDIRIENVCKFSKTGYIPYYYSTSSIILDGFDKHFQKFLNFYFTDHKITADYFNHKFFKKSKGNQIAYNLGYPSLEMENLFCETDRTKTKDKKIIVWTPRWTTNPELGGSNFFKYIDSMLDYFIDNEKFIFIFRPHPLLFSNFVSTGELTEEKKNEILTRIEKSSNSYYDDARTYKPTLNYCDILICDTSGIILDFATLNKTIIFCDNALNQCWKNLSIMDEIKNANYVADSFEDIVKFVDNLNDDDIKRNARKRLSNKLLNENRNASKKISSKIIELTKM